MILFAPAMAGESGLMRAANGGTAIPVTSLDEALSETNQAWPLFLPDGKHFLVHRNYAGAPAIHAWELNSSSSTRLMPIDISVMSYAPPGYLLYAPGRMTSTPIMLVVNWDAELKQK